jgi:hypothetical protein
MMLGGFMGLVIRAGDAPLAIVVIRAQRSCAREEDRGAQCRRAKNRAKPPGVQWKLHSFSLVAAAARACGYMCGKRAGVTRK